MSAQFILNDDDLTLYALRLLPDAEAALIARHLEENTGDRRRLALIELTLGIFAELNVEMQPVPENSLNRLLQAIEEPKKLAPLPKPVAARVKGRQWSIFDLLPWAGWAVAATLALLVAGHYAPRQTHFANELAGAQAKARQAATAAKQINAENSALRTALQQTSEQAAATQNKASDAERQAAALRAKADAAIAEATKQGVKADDSASVAKEASRERDILQGQLSAQSARAAQIAAQSADAQSVVAALSNPSALRVTLTVPKKKINPSGRGAYLASTGALVFIGSNLPVPETNKVYELWLMPSDGSAPIPAGTFVPDAAGNATVVNAKFRQNVAANGFAVTIENQGGSQTPTLPLVLAGT
ncbi:anti-sigma factor domain-containing protein [Terriglobus sp.]|uniref:anti-sigma factor n=1 Tax=Terriglobus sp. TaxID=1889013 RepID=UPI003B00C331